MASIAIRDDVLCTAVGECAGKAHIFLGDDAWDAARSVALPNGQSAIVVSDKRLAIRAEGQIEEVAACGVEALTCWIKQTAIWENANIAGYNLCLARACRITVAGEVDSRYGCLCGSFGFSRDGLCGWRSRCWGKECQCSKRNNRCESQVTMGLHPEILTIMLYKNERRGQYAPGVQHLFCPEGVETSRRPSGHAVL